MIGQRWHDTLMAHRAPVDSTKADSVYQADQIRVLQHILFKVDQHAEPPVARGAAEEGVATLAKIRGGANFGTLATQLSDDYSSKNHNGYLPPSPRGRFVTAFDSAGWSLAPGDIAGLIETPFGYHIIRRPPLAEVRPQLLAYLQERAGVRLDSMYLDSLSTARKLDVSGEAPKLMRAAFLDRNKSLPVDGAGGQLSRGRVDGCRLHAVGDGSGSAVRGTAATGERLSADPVRQGDRTEHASAPPGRFRRNSSQRRGMERCHAEVSGPD